MKIDIRKVIAFPLISSATFLSLSSCDVEKVQDGKMPKVEITEEGRLPKYDVDAPEIEVTTEKKVIEVPKVNITPAKED